MKTGDVIVEFDGKPVKDSRGLKLMVGQAAPGAKVEVKALRDGKEKTFTVMLKEMPEKLLASGPAQDDGEALHGVTVRDIDADARRQFDLPATLQGALISKIDSDSAAYDAGLRKGDVIQEINRQPIASAEHQPSIVEISAAGAELRSAPLATP